MPASKTTAAAVANNVFRLLLTGLSPLVVGFVRRVNRRYQTGSDRIPPQCEREIRKKVSAPLSIHGAGWPRSSDRGLSDVRSLVVGRIWDPSGLIAVVLKARCLLQGVLGRVHRQIDLVVFSSLFDRSEAHRNVLFTRTEKATHAENGGFNPAILSDQDVHNLADLVVMRIVHVLLIPIGNGQA